MSHPSETAPSSDCAGVTCNFAQFLVSLGSSAMVHLGVTPDPSGATTKDLHLATHTLSVLQILQVKTKGNLDADEERLLQALVDEIGAKVTAAQAQG